MNRRGLLQNSAVIAAIAVLGIKPDQVHSAEGDLLKCRMGADIQVLDPSFMIGGSETSIQFACLPRLAIPVKNEQGQWGWEPSEYVEKITQDDPTHISFTLKPGFMWSGGLGEVSAEDVKFSFERMLQGDWRTRWPTLILVEVKDKYSGVIVLKSPFAATFLIGVASESGTILPKVAVKKLKDQRFTTELPGQCGPYNMVEWTPKQKVVLKANPEWKGTKPAFPEVHFINVDETSTAELAFEVGEIHITGIRPQTVQRYQKQMPAGAKLENVPGPYYTWIGMNTEHPKLKDIRVRKAIQRAIDVKSILDAAYDGSAPQAHGVIPIGVLGNRTQSKYSYNPDEARKLLDEAGVKDLTLEFKTLSEAYRVTAAQIVHQNLADVGIKVEIIPLDSGPFWNLGLEAKGDEWKDLQIWWMQYRSSPDPSDPIQWFIKSQVGIWNWERWSDPKFEELWVKGLAETDNNKREDIYLRMQEIMEDTGAYVWITWDLLFYVHSDKIVPKFDTGGELVVEQFKKA